MRRCTGRRATLTPRRRMVLRQCVFQYREADPDGLRSWVEVRRTINDVDHQTRLLLRLRSACLAVSRPNDNPKGAPSMKPHKLSINSHRTRNLLPAVLIGDVRNSPFRQHRWLLQGLLRQQAPTRLDSCCRERKNDKRWTARPSWRTRSPKLRLRWGRTGRSAAKGRASGLSLTADQSRRDRSRQ
jgi:hypothetical protein